VFSSQRILFEIYFLISCFVGMIRASLSVFVETAFIRRAFVGSETVSLLIIKVEDMMFVLSTDSINEGMNE